MFSGNEQEEYEHEQDGGNDSPSAPREESFTPMRLQIPNITRELKSQDTSLRNRLGDQEDNEFNKLLFFYRQRIDQYDDERIEWLQKIEETRENQREKHQLVGQLEQLKQVVGEVQQSIAEQKLSAFAERIAFLNLTRTNSELKVRDVHNRKRIAEMLALTDPKKNSSITVNSNKQANRLLSVQFKSLHEIDRSKLTTNSTKAVQNELNIFNAVGGGRRLAGVEERQQLTTVYFPNENLNGIALENSSLKAQQTAEREVFEREFEQLQRDLKVREKELQLKLASDRESEAIVKKHLSELEQKHYKLNKQYFEVRRKCNDSVQKLIDEKGFLQQRNTQLTAKLELAQKATAQETEAFRELETKKSNEYTRSFQNKVSSKTEKIEVIKEQYAQIQNMYQQKLRELEITQAELVQSFNILQADSESEKQQYSANIAELQNEYEALKEEQIERGLVPAKPEFRTHEQRLLDQQLQLQHELKLEKLDRKRQKERLYLADATNRNTLVQKPRRQTASLVKSAAPKQQHQRSFQALSEIDEADNQLNHSFKRR